MFHTVSSWYFSQRFGYIHGATKSEHWMCWECVESVKKTFSSINGVASSNVTPLTSWNFGCRSLKGTVTIVFHLCSHFSHVLRIMYDWANNTCKVIKEIRLTFIKGKKKACIMSCKLTSRHLNTHQFTPGTNMDLDHLWSDPTHRSVCKYFVKKIKKYLNV